jgi:serine/threonine protein kinase
MPLTAGTILGQYEIRSPIGAGGMGEVYRAHDTRLDRDVAIKVLPDYVTSDSERLRRFEQEARATAALNHPNILAVYQMATDNGVSYLVEELLEGETLRERLRNGPIPLRKAIDYAVQIANGLAAAHDRGIVHRDLKPENIFVTRDGRVKILDFGLARLGPSKERSGEETTEEQRTDPGVVLGTAGYMSPEQVRGKTVDQRTDIFAFGAILYEMVTGKQPFRKPTSAETMTAILNEEPPAISQVNASTPLGMQRVVHRCLEKSPQQRFHSAHDLAFALEALSETGSGALAVERSRSTKQWLLLVAASAAVAVIAGLLVWWRTPAAVPVVESVTQLTDDGEPKVWGSVVNDGSRIYFSEGPPGSKKIAQVSVAGGETSIISTRLPDPQIEGIAPDGSSLLVFDGEVDLKPIWKVPLPTGEPRRLRALEGQDGSFFPDGRVIFVKGADVYVADNDGSNSHKLLTTPGTAWCPRVSPDGRQIVVLTYLAQQQALSLAEVASDGSGYHEIARGTESEPVRCSYWSGDGKWLFSRFGTDVWVLPASRGWFARNRKPVQLTHGPLDYWSLSPSRDGKHLFSIGVKQRGELVRYDASSRQFVLMLPGISPMSVSFSRDGQWIAYASYPDRVLWRIKADGTDKMQLTYSPMEAVYPYISPDGTKVAFGDRGKLFVVNSDGSDERAIATEGSSDAPHWSPDGKELVFQEQIPGKSTLEKDSMRMVVLNLESGRRSVVPAAPGVGWAFWIDLNTLLAVTDDSLVSVDINSGKGTTLVKGLIVNWNVSLDGQYAYYTTGGPEPKAMRIRLKDRKIEEVSSLKNLRLATDVYTYIAVGPDGSPYFTRDIGSQEVYALTIKWP